MLKKLLGAACGDDNNCQSDECHDNCRSECHSKVWHCLVVDKVEDKVKSIVAEQLGLDVAACHNPGPGDFCCDTVES